MQPAEEEIKPDLLQEIFEELTNILAESLDTEVTKSFSTQLIVFERRISERFVKMEEEMKDEVKQMASL